MRSLEERLVDSDPAAGATYVHPNYDDMLRRIVATPYAQRTSTWRGFKLRMASSVLVASLVTGLGITALNTSTTPLPILGFVASTVAPQTSSSTHFGASTMSPNFNYRYTNVGAFSSSARSGVAYAISAPRDGAHVVEQVARVLKVDVGIPHFSKSTMTWTSSGADYSAWLVRRGGFDSWRITRTAPLPPTPTTPILRTGQLTALALSFAQQMGEFRLGSPIMSAGPGASATSRDVTIPTVVDGVVTNLPFTFELSVNGTILAASGENFTLRPAGTYPLLSFAAGVGEISAQRFLARLVVLPGQGFIAYSGVAGGSSYATTRASGVANSTGTVGPPPAAIDSAPTTVASTLVALTSVFEQYGVFPRADGSPLLLPLYVYSGDARTNPSYPVSSRIVAIDPSYLNFTQLRPGNY